MYSFRDWNPDGKVDEKDLAFDYYLYSNSESKGSGGGSGQNKGGCGCSSGASLMIILLFFASLLSYISR